MNELALFAGAGGGILGGKLLGWNTIGAVEIERYPRECLLQRQRDGVLPRFPIWDDVRTFDGKPWFGLVDIISGGFPCQDISCAGKGAGISGARSGLWREMFRIICEVRPRFAFMENSPMLLSRGIDRVLGDLAEAGYNAEWLVLGAGDIGAPHQRDRIWILGVSQHADRDFQSEVREIPRRKQETKSDGVCTEISDTEEMAYANNNGRRKESIKTGEPGQTLAETPPKQSGRAGGSVHRTDSPWSAEPGLGRMADGVAHRVDRLKAIGNGQVAAVACIAFFTLLRRFEQADF